MSTSIVKEYKSMKRVVTAAIVRRIDALQAELRNLPPTTPAVKVVDAEGAVVLEIAPPTNDVWDRWVDNVQCSRDVDSGLDLLFDYELHLDAVHQKFIEAQQAHADVLARIQKAIAIASKREPGIADKVLARRWGLNSGSESTPEDASNYMIRESRRHELTSTSNAVRAATATLKEVLYEYRELANDRFPLESGWGKQVVSNVASDPWTMDTTRIVDALRTLDDSIAPLQFQLSVLADEIRVRSTMAKAGAHEAAGAQLARSHGELLDRFAVAGENTKTERELAEELMTVRYNADLIGAFKGGGEDWEEFIASNRDVEEANVVQVRTLLHWKQSEDDTRKLLADVGTRYFLLQTMIDLHRQLLVAKYIHSLKADSADTILDALRRVRSEHSTRSCRDNHASDDWARKVLLWFAIPVQEEKYGDPQKRREHSYLHLESDQAKAQTALGSLPSLLFVANDLIDQWGSRIRPL